MIRLTLSTDYALRILLYLASRPERQVSTREVIQFYEVSPDHVAKVVQQLVRAGYVRAGRGRTGGLRLARPPAQITVASVVEVFEGPVTLLDCVSTEGICVIQPGCRLRLLLQRAGAQLVETLSSVTLADLVSPGEPALVQLLGRD